MVAIDKRTTTLFFREVSVMPLVAFRIIFGFLMLVGITRFVLYGWVDDLYISPPFHFTYYGFGWVHPLPGNWMYLPFIVMMVASIGIIAGYRFRLSAALFFFCFTYVELIDKSTYLNHYYLVSLLAFLLCWLPANVNFSLDAKRNPGLYRSTVPAWTILVLQLQLGLVYFCAGIAKLNPDWLFEAQPLYTWLQAFRDLPVLGSLFASMWLAYLFSWFGCVYDLTVPFFLSNKKTRGVAYVFVVLFHLVTWLLFPIGLFPWLMILCTLIFFPASFHEKWIKWVQKLLKWNDPKPRETRIAKPNRFIYILLGIYFFVQVSVPFRYLLYPGNLFWTEEGFRFSWRVMLMHKEGYATFYITDPGSGQSKEIRNMDYLTPNQIDQMSTQPDMILQFAHYLGERFSDTVLIYGSHQIHLKNPEVGADVFVSLNGRPHQQMVERSKDLLKEPYSLKHRFWVKELKETR